MIFERASKVIDLPSATNQNRPVPKIQMFLLTAAGSATMSNKAETTEKYCSGHIVPLDELI